MLRSWLQSLAIYRDRRMATILFLGFSSGLPLLLTLSTLTAWLKEEGIEKKTIGLFALVGSAYSFKFIWAPLIDRLHIPVLGRLLGRRRSWILVTQAGLMLSTWGLASTDPSANPLATAQWAVIVAFCSASQDIVIDAYRVEILAKDQQGAGSGVIVLGYRLAMLVAGAGSLMLAEWFGWNAAYRVMAGLVLVGVVAVLLSPEPAVSAAVGPARSWVDWFRGAVFDPFVDFMTRPGWAAILLFILLYRLGDSLAGIMANPFYLEMGFTKPEIAGVTKVFGLAATIIGGLMGGVLVARYGIVRTLFVCGFVHMLANFLSAVQAVLGHDVGFLIVTIGAENLSGGMGTTAFVAYLSTMCSVAYTATQYALLSSLTAVGRNVLSAGSGWLAERLGWVGFYCVTAAAALPALLLLVWMTRRFPLDEKAA